MNIISPLILLHYAPQEAGIAIAGTCIPEKLIQCSFWRRRWGFCRRLTKGDNKVMRGRPALIRQRDCKQIIGAAKKSGAKLVEFRVGKVQAIVRLDESAERPVADANEWLTDDSHSA